MRITSLETWKDNKARIAREKAVAKAFRNERKERFQGGSQEDIELVNIFRDLGIDYFSAPRGQLLRSIPETIEGRKVSSVPERALAFLKENYGVEHVVVDGRRVLHFNKGENMGLIGDVADKAERSKGTCQQIYDALVEVIQDELKKERRIRLPKLGILKVRYRPAREKRKGRNPATGEKMWFKAKPASNKLAFRPLKELKKFVDSEIKVKKH